MRQSLLFTTRIFVSAVRTVGVPGARHIAHGSVANDAVLRAEVWAEIGLFKGRFSIHTIVYNKKFL
jgi:hypothetical protein